MNGSTSASIERPYGWVIVVASLLLMTTGTGSLYAVVVALKPIAADFDWPRWVPSLAYSLGMLGMGAGGILMGRWSDRVGNARPAALGALGVATGSYLVSVSDGPVLFLAAYGLLIGVFGNGALFVPLVANATRWFDRRRGVAVAIVASGQFMAGFLWPLVFRPLIETVGWRQMFVYYALFVLAVGLPLCLFLRPRPPVPDLAASEATRTPAAEARPLGLTPARLQTVLCCAGVGCCIAMAIPMVHLVAYATDLGFSLARGAECLSVLLGCGFVGRIAWGAVTDRIGGLATLAASSSLQLVALASFMAVDGLAGLFAVSALFGLAFGGIVPSYSIIVRELFPTHEIGRRIGAVYFFTTLGMAVGGVAGGVAFDASGGYLPAFAVGVLFNLANLSLVVPLLHRRRRTATA